MDEGVTICNPKKDSNRSSETQIQSENAGGARGKLAQTTAKQGGAHVEAVCHTVMTRFLCRYLIANYQKLFINEFLRNVLYVLKTSKVVR